MTPKPHNDPVAEAEQELADALAHEADIENRYAEGEDVPATVFEQADQRKTMAQRGIERAKRMVQRRKEIEALTVIEALDHDVAAHNTAARIEPVRDAYAEAVEAVRNFQRIHRDFQREADQLESRARRADHRVKITRIDSGTHGKPWPEQLLADARGYARIHDRSSLPQAHALDPEHRRLRSARAQLNEKLAMHYRGDLDAMRADEPDQAARYDRITARLTELDQES